MSNIKGLSSSGDIEGSREELIIKRLYSAASQVRREFGVRINYEFTEEDNANIQNALDALTALSANIVQYNLKEEEAELKMRLSALQLQIVRD